jgi:nudix-type nucleoside diphosphatase (YffH/AdpP family)
MEKTLMKERVFDGRLVKVDRLDVELDNGAKSVREIVDFPEVAVVLAMDHEGKVLLVRQFRKAVEGDLIEPVAGKVEPGETPEQAARREFKEETGYECKKLKKAGVVYPTPGYSTEKQHYFLTAVSGSPVKQSGDDDEKIDIVWMSGDQILELASSGKPLDGKLLMAIAFSAVLDELGEDWDDDGGTVFVSGHLDLTREEFDAHYRDELVKHVDAGDSFIVGDAKGCDSMVQEFLAARKASVTVYHMFERPRNNAGNFPTVGGFKSDNARDSAMTAASDDDLAWVRPGRAGSGTDRNVARRRHHGKGR